MSNTFTRLSARRGQIVDLNVDFLNNGVPADPYAITHVDIYKTQVLPHNLVATIPFVDPDDPSYPSPAVKETTGEGTEAQELVGKYHLLFNIPGEFAVPDVYFDVWNYFPTNPCEGEETCDLQDYADSQLQCCHRFWVYPDEWFCDDRLQTIRFAFEPLDQRFNTPEYRPLEVGLMPLPLYDFNFNLVTPIIPFLQPTITIETQHCELLVDNAPCEMGLRHGSYRTNPWVIKYYLDTNQFLKGTYRYQIKLLLPNGTTIVSKKFIFTIS